MLTVVRSVLDLFVLCVVAATLSVNRNDLVVVHLNAAHRVQIEFHHLSDVQIEIQQPVDEYFDPELIVNFLFAALIPPSKLANVPGLYEYLILKPFTGQ